MSQVRTNDVHTCRAALNQCTLARKQQIEIELAALLNSLSFEPSFTVSPPCLTVPTDPDLHFFPFCVQACGAPRIVPTTDVQTMMTDDDRGYLVRRPPSTHPSLRPDLFSVAVGFLGRFSAFLTRHAARIPSVLTHAKLRMPPRSQRRSSRTRQRQRPLTASFRASRGFPVVPLGTRRVLRRVQRTRVTVGEISTAYGRQRRHGCGEDAPHRGVVLVWIKRLEMSNYCIVLAYIIT